MTMPQTRHYEMKDSGVEWIGKMPRHWNTLRLQKIYRIKKDIAGTAGHTVLSVTQHGIKPKNMDSKGQFALDYSKYQLVKSGDFVMNHMDLLTGWVDISKYDGVTSPDYRVFTSIANCQNTFFKYIFQFCYMNRVFYGLGQGVADVGRWRLPADMFRKFMLPVPPLSEQTAIAAYLDEKCATIDAIIAEAKASIEEYKSWKSSVIFEAVTKGLNPNAEMKDSGVEWIGEIPKGWEVSAVKRHYSITLGKMLESVPQSNDATLENYMCASNVKWGGIDTTTNRQMWFSPIEKEEYLLKEGDLLVMEGGSAGTSTIYRGEYAPCYMQNSVNRCRSKDGSLTHFLYYWMFLVYHSGHVESACNRATIMHLTKEKLGRIPFVYVPEEEQASIVSYLDRKCSLIDGVILEKEELIRELENYKRSLIFEVVTGKRRVC